MSEQYKYITRGYVLYNEKFDGYVDKNGLLTDRPHADICANIRWLQMIKNKRSDRDELVIKKVATIHLEDDLNENK